MFENHKNKKTERNGQNHKKGRFYPNARLNGQLRITATETVKLDTAVHSDVKKTVSYADLYDMEGWTGTGLGAPGRDGKSEALGALLLTLHPPPVLWPVLWATRRASSPGVLYIASGTEFLRRSLS